MEKDSVVAEELATRLLQRWGLSLADQSRLLGRDSDSPNAEEMMDRVGWLVSIHKSLRVLYPKNPEILYSWVSRRNEAFDNKTPREIFLEEGVAGMKRVSGYLEGIVML